MINYKIANNHNIKIATCSALGVHPRHVDAADVHHRADQLGVHAVPLHFDRALPLDLRPAPLDLVAGVYMLMALRLLAGRRRQRARALRLASARSRRRRAILV